MVQKYTGVTSNTSIKGAMGGKKVPRIVQKLSQEHTGLSNRQQLYCSLLC